MHKTEYRGAQDLRIVKFSSLYDPWRSKTSKIKLILAVYNSTYVHMYRCTYTYQKNVVKYWFLKTLAAGSMHMHKTEYRGAQSRRIVKFSSLCDPWHPPKDISAKHINNKTSETRFWRSYVFLDVLWPKKPRHETPYLQKTRKTHKLSRIHIWICLSTYAPTLLYLPHH